MGGELQRALSELRAGRPVVIPTDTVYGIAADPWSPRAIAAIFATKGRSPDKPLPVLAAGLDDAARVARFDRRARSLAARFWPGPLTLVLQRAPGFDADLGAGDRTSVAVRIPSHALALQLLRAAGPLAVTSANRSGQPAATTVDEARAALGGAVEVFVDGGEVRGRESTIVSLLDGLTVLRAGPISEGELDQTLKS